MKRDDIKYILEQVRDKKLHYSDGEIIINKMKAEDSHKEPSNNSDKIAVIGFACRFPQAPDPDTFWGNIYSGKDSISEIPETRWALKGFYNTDSGPDDNTSYAKWGGFLDSISKFDIDFFGLKKEDVMSMDPQQLLALEIVWEALEHSGYGNISKAGSDTGVFFGARGNNFTIGMLDRTREFKVKASNRNYIVGRAQNMVAARISDFLNLKGPSVIVDAACSSSLVSVHMAATGILAGDCKMAIAGGVDLLVNPESYVGLSKAKAISPDGRCFTFDKRANGYVPGEGAGAVILKAYKDALADGDRIYAVILGSAVNNDGHTMGITTPDLDGQKAVVKKALKRAGVLPETISLVEAHGTGTTIGDPIEIKALTEVYRESTDKRSFCGIGSIKTNIGHLHCAAGIAGFLKLVLALDKKVIPPTINCLEPNPRFDFVESPFYTVSKASPWETENGVRRAAISSFGFGGTNCHIVLEEGTVPMAEREEQNEIYAPMIITARETNEMKALISKYIEYFENTEKRSFINITASASAREQFNKRLFINSDGLTALKEKMSMAALEKYSSDKSVFYGSKTKDRSNKTVFMFTGQGALYTGVARTLYETSRIFRQTIDRCSEIISGYIGTSIRELLYKPENTKLLGSTYITQPVTFAVNYALFMLWRSFGHCPSVVMGHSLGEYVAACAAGVYSLEEILPVVAQRGRLMQELPENGGMVVMFAGVDSVRNMIDSLTGSDKALVSIATVNGPMNTVIAGDKRVLGEICNKAAESSIKFTQLQVSHAFHSPLMKPVLDGFRKVIEGIKPKKAKIKIISNLTGNFIDEKTLTAEYWLDHIMNPVLFAPGIEKLLKDKYRIFVEVGPGTTLTSMAKQIPQGIDDAVVMSTLSRNKSDWQQFFDTAGEMFTRGVDLDCEGFFKSLGANKIPLPTYPFTRQELIQYQPVGRNQENQQLSMCFDEILKQNEDQVSYYKVFDCENEAVFIDHNVKGEAVLPGVYHLTMVLEAYIKAFGKSVTTFEGIKFLEPVKPDESKVAAVRMSVTNGEHSGFIFEKLDESSGYFKEVSSGTIGTASVVPQSKYSIDGLKSEMKLGVVNSPELYKYFEDRGLKYGPLFRGVKRVWIDKSKAIAEIENAAGGEYPIGKTYLHPGILDSAFHAISALLLKKNSLDTYIPFYIEKLTVYKEMTDICYSYVKLSEDFTGGDILRSDVQLLDAEGNLQIEVKGFTLRRLSGNGSEHGTFNQNLFYQPAWEKIQTIAAFPEAEDKKVLVFLRYGNELHEGILKAVSRTFRNVYKVFEGEKFSEVSKDSFTINPDSKEQYVNLIEKVSGDAGNIDMILHLWTLGNFRDDSDFLVKTQTKGTISLLYLLQAVRRVQKGSGIKLLAVSDNCQPISGGSDVLYPEKAAILGVIKTIPLEFENIEAVHLDLDCKEKDLQQIPGKVLMELVAKNSSMFVGYRNGDRFVQKIRKISGIQPIQGKAIKFEKGATYVILGGLGGLGLEFIRHISKTIQANFAIISRSDFPEESKWGQILYDNSNDYAGIKDKIGVLRQVILAGSRVHVFKADITDYNQMENTFDQIRSRFGPIRGLIHSAGVLNDSLILNIDRNKFESVVYPKMLGAWIADRITEKDPVDFMILFSGLVSYVGILGQSSHTAANCFEDSFAYYRNYVRKRRTLAINWGVWGGTGIVATPYYIESLRDQGFAAMNTQEALEAFDGVISTGLVQIGIGHITQEKYRQVLRQISGNICLAPEERYFMSIVDCQKDAKLLIENIDKKHEADFGENIDRLSSKFSLEYFNYYGVFTDEKECFTRAEVMKRCNMLEKFSKLLDAMINMLLEDGILKEEDGLLRRKDASYIEDYWGLSKTFKAVFPVESVYARILDQCFKNYKEVLSGSLNPMHVLFPGGSVEMLEELYHLPSPFNFMTGKTVRNLALSYNGQKTVRILEIGGGTGGTTAKILPQINGLNVEYTFTDISAVFIKHASESFKGYSFMKYRVLDIEKNLGAQGMDGEKFDIVVAANVLHATKELKHTFTQVMRMMNPDAALIMMETTRDTRFADLVFGLTDGWWKFEDSEYRKISALMTPQEWEETLTKIGFLNVKALPVNYKPSVRYPYSVIIANSLKYKQAIQEATAAPEKTVENKKRITETVKKSEETIAEGEAAVAVDEKLLLEFAGEVILAKIADLLNIEGTDQVPVDSGFLEMGLDSLSLVALSGKIEKEIGIKLYPTVFFEHQTVEALADYFIEKYHDEFLKSLNATYLKNEYNTITEKTSIVDDTAAVSVNLTEKDQTEDIKPLYETVNFACTTQNINVERATKECEPFVACELNSKEKQDIDTDIAIIGMAGIFPGADDVDALWDNLIKGVSSIREFDESRWGDMNDFNEKPQKGKTYAKWAGLLDGVDLFDAQFFNISNREAKRMDPQQRIFMEAAWAAAENGGYANKKLINSNTGVFVGVSNHNYHSVSYDPDDTFCTLSTSNAMAANRVSYFLDLNGPSMTTDTQCSSSLVALNYACRSIQAGECEMAIVGGVNAVLPKEYYILLSQVKAISPDGKCKTFDKDANGFISGEGSCAILIKPLKKALADKDNIHAVIRSTMINHDGRSSNVSAPNAKAQCMVITNAMEKAGVHPESVSYIEAHGTGTSLGDPVEISALTKSFEKYTDKKSFCAIGSLKTNIGHLEAAAGLAGLVKVVLALKNKILPPSLNFNQPNPYLDFNQTPFFVVDKPLSWVSEGPLRAGVSSFGMGGTNAHVILEEAPAQYGKEDGKGKIPFNVMTISAKSKVSLKSMLNKLARHLEACPDKNLNDICYTMNTGRSHFQYRLSIVSDKAGRLLHKLNDIMKKDIDKAENGVEGVYYTDLSGINIKSGLVKAAYFVSERGFDAESLNSLLREKELGIVFDLCASALGMDIQSFISGNLDEVKCSRKIYDVFYNFACRVSLAGVLLNLGVVPDAVRGSMKVANELKVISGEKEIGEVLSDMMADYGMLQSVPKNNTNYLVFPKAPVVLVKEDESIFLTNFKNSEKAVMVEIGPDDYYSDVFKCSMENQNAVIDVIPVVQPGKTDWYSIMSLIGRLYSKGVDVDFNKLSGKCGGRMIEMPTYAFEHRPYWVENKRKPVLKPFEPTELKGRKVKNRLIKSAIEIGMASNTGKITDEYINYYNQWTYANVGIKIAGNFMVSADCRVTGSEVVISSSDSQVEEIRKLAQLAKCDGALFIAQLNHAGAEASEKINGCLPIGPSMLKTDRMECRAASDEDLRRIIKSFAHAAKTLKTGGCDGVEIHAAHGYLLSEFISPKFNTRSDMWGGDAAGRASLASQIVKAVRDEVGEDFIICVKIDAPDKEKNGMTIEDVIVTSQVLEKSGVDLIEVSLGVAGKEEIKILESGERQKLILSGIKKYVKVPLAITGGFRNFDSINRTLSNGDCEFAGIGRPLLNNPNFVKEMKDDSHAKASCISCSLCLYSLSKGSVRCVKNKKPEAAFNPEDHMFRSQWMLTQEPTGTGRLQGCYVVLGYSEEKTRAAGEALQSLSASVIYVRPGREYAKTHDGYSINYSLYEDYGRVVEDILQSHNDRLEGFVFIADDNVNHPSQAQKLAFDAAVFIPMYIGKAIISKGISKPLRLLTVSFNGVVVPGDMNIIPSNTLMHGLSRVLPFEVKNVSVLSIDFDPRIKKSEYIKKLALEFSNINKRYMEVSYRNGQRFERKIVPYNGKGQKDFEISGGVYLLIGGTSALGMIFADYLASKGAKAILLTGRKSLQTNTNPEVDAINQKIDKIREKGALVKYILADAADSSAMEKMAVEIKKEFGSISGIIHCAGLVDKVNRTIRTKSCESFTETVSPKYDGTINIANILKELQPEFAFFCSSIAALNGRLGAALCDYAAGNFFMDEYAKWLAAGYGKKVLSINWAMWKGVGLGARPAQGEETYTLSVEEGIKVFEALLRMDVSGNLAVMNSKDSKFSLEMLNSSEVSLAEARVVEEKVIEERVTEEKSYRDADTAADLLVRKIQKKAGEDSVSKDNLEKEVERFVRQLLIEFLQLAEDQINNNTDFSEYGIDSVIVADMVGAIEKKYNILAHPSIILDYPNIHALVRYLIDECNVISYELQCSEEENETSDHFQNETAPLESLNTDALNNIFTAVSSEADKTGKRSEGGNIDDLLDEISKGEISVEDALVKFGGAI